MTETWEMVQLATENHNFHMHQSRFVERTGNTGSVIQDNFPLGVAVPDATIADQVANNQTRRLHGRSSGAAAIASRRRSSWTFRSRSSASSSTTATSSSTRTGA